MGMSSSQPQPITQGTMGSPTKSYGPVGDMLGSAQNQVNPQSSPTGTMNNLMGSLPSNGWPNQNAATPGQGVTGVTGGEMGGGMPGFMPMGNSGFMPMGFGQMPQQPQMPTFGGPRGGKAPQ